MIQKTLEYDVVQAQTEPYNNYPPYQKGSETSEGGADAIAPKRDTLQLKVLRFIASQGIYGATDIEIAKALGIEKTTTIPRRRELERKQIIKKFGTRPNPKTNRANNVYVTTGQKQKAMRQDGLK